MPIRSPKGKGLPVGRPPPPRSTSCSRGPPPRVAGRYKKDASLVAVIGRDLALLVDSVEVDIVRTLFEIDFLVAARGFRRRVVAVGVDVVAALRAAHLVLGVLADDETGSPADGRAFDRALGLVALLAEEIAGNGAPDGAKSRILAG